MRPADLERRVSQTAQVANQQGVSPTTLTCMDLYLSSISQVYLGKKFSKIASSGHEMAVQNNIYDDPDDLMYKPFKYRHSACFYYY